MIRNLWITLLEARNPYHGSYVLSFVHGSCRTSWSVLNSGLSNVAFHVSAETEVAKVDSGDRVVPLRLRRRRRWIWRYPESKNIFPIPALGEPSGLWNSVGAVEIISFFLWRLRSLGVRFWMINEIISISVISPIQVVWGRSYRIYFHYKTNNGLCLIRTMHVVIRKLLWRWSTTFWNKVAFVCIQCDLIERLFTVIQPQTFGKTLEIGGFRRGRTKWYQIQHP